LSGTVTVRNSAQGPNSPSLVADSQGQVAIGGQTSAGTMLHVVVNDGTQGPDGLAVTTQNDAAQGKGLLLNPGWDQGWSLLQSGSDNGMVINSMNSGYSQMSQLSIGAKAVGINKWPTQAIAALDVSGSISASSVIQVSGTVAGCAASLGGAIRYNAGNMEYCNGVGPGWSQFASSGAIQADRIISGTANAIANLNTGISTSVPLEVSGAVKVAGTGSETCGPTTHGTMRVNPADGSLELCRQ
jgi:hypothetical protein